MACCVHVLPPHTNYPNPEATSAYLSVLGKPNRIRSTVHLILLVPAALRVTEGYLAVLRNEEMSASPTHILRLDTGEVVHAHSYEDVESCNSS